MHRRLKPTAIDNPHCIRVGILEYYPNSSPDSREIPKGGWGTTLQNHSVMVCRDLASHQNHPTMRQSELATR